MPDCPVKMSMGMLVGMIVGMFAGMLIGMLIGKFYDNLNSVNVSYEIVSNENVTKSIVD